MDPLIESILLENAGFTVDAEAGVVRGVLGVG
jgi:hypothetical protein